MLSEGAVWEGIIDALKLIFIIGLTFTEKDFTDNRIELIFQNQNINSYFSDLDFFKITLNNYEEPVKN